MIEYTVYDKTSGMILRTGYCPDDQFSIQAQENSISEGIYPNDKYYWQDGEFINMPPKPDGFYDFDYTTKTWVLIEQQAIQSALNKRDQLLKEGPDRINPMWWESMTAEQQQQWQIYRQELLDITKQPGYPNDIIWPIKPTEGA